MRDELVIKYNNCAANGTCPLCGGRTDPQIPLAIFMRGDYCDVCDVCAKTHAPELSKLLEYFYSEAYTDALTPEGKTLHLR